MVIRLNGNLTNQAIKLANITPTTQRFLIGATGLISHTTIDALNPYVDKETRKYSAVRSAVKMVICTMSGMITRHLGQKLGEWAVNAGKVAVPEGLSKAAFTLSVGRVFAIAGAVASIFLIDVPFINKILNVVMSKVFHVKKPGEKPADQPKQVNHNA